MSPELREIKFGKIDQEAERQRAAAEYIITLIESNEEQLREAFVPEGTDEDDVPLLLYEKVTRTLDDLAEEYTRPAGIVLTYLKPGDTRENDPVVQLGWGAYAPAIGGIEKCAPHKLFPHRLMPTESAVEIINGLRAAQGLVTLNIIRSSSL